MVSDLNIFAHKWSQISAAKKVFIMDYPHLFTPFKRLFTPTSQSPMSKLFRFSKSLGKSNEKIWQLFLIKGVRSPRQKKVFYIFFFICSLRLNVFFNPTSQSQMSKLFRFLEVLAKSNEKKWPQIWKLLLIKGVKSPLQKKFICGFFFLTPFKRLFAPTS